MSVAIANVLSAGSDFALNSYISPRYAKLDTRLQSPASPAPVFFSIWTPIFAGRIAYGFLKEEERTPEATLWNHAVSVAGFTYAYTMVNKRFYSMQAAMAAMTFASFKYRSSLGELASPAGRAVATAAEMGLGWLVAADLVLGAKNKQRLVGRKFTHAEQDAVGVAEAAVIAGAAVAANRLKGWSGVSIAAAWALTGVAVSDRSEKHVRVVAGLAAVGVLADLAIGRRI